MTKRKWQLAALIYVALVCFTFGHAFANTERWKAEHCTTLTQRVEAGVDCYRDTGTGALLASVWWPLYWSKELQK